MRVIALPVKSLENSKARLAGVLTPTERSRLTLELLRIALDACLPLSRAEPPWSVWVISRDAAVLETARSAGAMALQDESGSLGEAVSQVETAALRIGAAALALLLPDLPLVSASALRPALEAAGDVVCVRAEPDGGTNLLVRRPPSVIPARFGPDSFALHRREAQLAGVTFSEFGSPELSFDVDSPSDLARLIEAGPRRRGHGLLDGVNLTRRAPVSGNI